MFPIRLSPDDYREAVADAIAPDLESDRRVDAKLFNGVCAFVERFLHGRAMCATRKALLIQICSICLVQYTYSADNPMILVMTM